MHGWLTVQLTVKLVHCHRNSRKPPRTLMQKISMEDDCYNFISQERKIKNIFLLYGSLILFCNFLLSTIIVALNDYFICNIVSNTDQIVDLNKFIMTLYRDETNYNKLEIHNATDPCKVTAVRSIMIIIQFLLLLLFIYYHITHIIMFFKHGIYLTSTIFMRLTNSMSSRSLTKRSICFFCFIFFLYTMCFVITVNDYNPSSGSIFNFDPFRGDYHLFLYGNIIPVIFLVLLISYDWMVFSIIFFWKTDFSKRTEL